MPTPIGTGVVTAISRRYILNEIADNIYNSNALFFRLNRMNKKQIQGGFQIELPIMYARFAAGGWYTGFDALNIAPSDTVQNAAFDWKQSYVPVTVDGRTLVRTDSPEAIANFLSAYFAQAQMEMAEVIGSALWYGGNGGAYSVPAKQLDPITSAIDDGTLQATYGGISKGAGTFWTGQLDKVSAALSFANMQTLFGKASFGGRHPTIIITTQPQYNNFIGLFSGTTYFQRGPGGYDEVLAQAGWTNALFNNVPVLVDSHVPVGISTAYAGKSTLWMLNENYIHLLVAAGVDFYLQDFITPVNQDAMSSKLFWMGNLCVNNLQTQAAFWNLT